MARTISHLFAVITREILFLPLKHKIHIFSPPCNILSVRQISGTVSTSKTQPNTQVKHCGVLISISYICLHNLCCMLFLPGSKRPMICNVLSNYSIRYQFTRGSPLLIGLTIKLSEAPFLGHINLEKKQVLPSQHLRISSLNLASLEEWILLHERNDFHGIQKSWDTLLLFRGIGEGNG